MGPPRATTKKRIDNGDPFVIFYVQMSRDKLGGTRMPRTRGPKAGDAPKSTARALAVADRPGLEVRRSDHRSTPAWVLLRADARQALEALAPDSVDCVVTSPPYYWQRDYGFDGQIGHESTIDGFVSTLRDCFREVRRVLKDDGSFFLNIGDTYYNAKGRPHGRDDKHRGRMLARRTLRAVDGPGLGLPRKSLIGIPWRVALALQQDGWTLRSDIVWRRPGSLPEPTAHDRPWNTHEHVFLFAKSPRYYFDRVGLEGEEDIWHIVSRPDNPGSHFAPFPSALAERCIRSGCRPGGIVLDPFAGSGTTLHVARALGHPAIGIDMSRQYVDHMENRLRSGPPWQPSGINAVSGTTKKNGTNGVHLEPKSNSVHSGVSPRPDR